MATKQTSIPWPFAPKTVGLNKDTSLMKLIAMVTMLIDHTGKMFFPQYRVMRVIGRIAFPIYAYCIAVGCVYSKDRLKYLGRIVLMGLVSQPIYAVAMDHATSAMYSIPFKTNPIGAAIHFYVESFAHPSIMLTLALGLLFIWSLRDRQPVLTVALAVLVWRIQGSIDYGWRGVALLALFYLFIERWWLSLPVMLAYMFWWGRGYGTYEAFGIRFGTQMFAIMALPFIYLPTFSKLKINKWVFYLYYPAHLLGMLLVELALGMLK